MPSGGNGGGSGSSRSRVMPNLPAGFRFHPTDEELMVHYLMRHAASMPCPVPIIAEVNIYQCNPWDLPGTYVTSFFISFFPLIRSNYLLFLAGVIQICIS